MSRNLALIGNPNCGKTTLFNLLTGSNQYVGNWAGVTVEKKAGKLKNTDYNIIDLPGIYSLSPYSLEEKITQEFLLNEKPDLIINIIDGTNFERNMYLSVQLTELNIPMIIAVNMMDDVTASGMNIDCRYLTELTGIPFIPISARNDENIDCIINEIHRMINCASKPIEIDYNRTTRNALNKVYSVIVSKNNPEDKPYPYFASKILEGDKSYEKYINLSDKQKTEINNIINEYELLSPYADRESLIADSRYQYIENLVSKAVTKSKRNDRVTLSDKIDLIVTNRFLAYPIFFFIIFFMFTITFGSVSKFLSNIIEIFFKNLIIPTVSFILTAAGAPEWTLHLITDGIIGGTSGILVFLPQIAIYALFAGAFFKSYQGLAVFSMYITGIIMAAIMGLIFRKTIFKNNKASFIMELPPYRRPLLKSVLKNTWDKTKGFIVKAGTVILSLSVLIWILQNFSPSLKFAENSSESIFAALGSVIAPFLKPLGFGTWQAAVSLLSGIAAKEAVVSTMSMLYSTDSTTALTTIISEVFTPVSACSFMVFSLLYMPCISAFATIKRETGSIKWALGIAVIQTITAYAVSFIVYQAGNILINI